MTAWQRDLTALELWHRSLEGSRRRRATVPRLRRRAARRKGASTAMAAAMFAGPAALAAAAPPSRSGSGHVALASEKHVDRSSTRLNSPPYVLLRLGSTGPAVAKVQRRLHIEADGHYGPKTKRAVRTFQGKHGLEVDGVVGPETWRALFGGVRNAETGAGWSSSSRHAPTTGASDRRASFAVRRASENEVDRLLDRDALPRPRDRSAAVAAIELRMPRPKDREKSSASGADGRTASSSQEGAASRKSRRNSDTRRARDMTEPRDATTPTATGSCGETLKWPTTATNVSSGYRTSQRPSHAGVDLDGGLNDEGNPVYAAACGVITLMQGTSESGGYGNFVCVKHTDRFVTCYAHLSRFASVSPGDYVGRGEVIGAVGNTGHSFGAHLHFETRRGTPYRDSDYSDFDPLPYLNGRPIPGDPVTPPQGGVGGPDLGEPERETERATVAHRSRAADRAHTAGPNRAGDGSDAAIDALEVGDPRAAPGSAATSRMTAQTSSPRSTGASQGEGDADGVAPSSTGQARSRGKSSGFSGDLDADDHFSTSDSASSVPGRWSTKGISGAASGGESGVPDQDEGDSPETQPRGGSGHGARGTSNRDEGKAALQDGSGASTPGPGGADSGVADAYATVSPNSDASATQTPDPSPLEEAPAEQSTGNESASAVPGETHNGGTDVIPEDSDSNGTTRAPAGEYRGGAVGGTGRRVGDGSESPADRSASGRGDRVHGAAETMEEGSRRESLGLEPDADTRADGE